MSQLEAYLEMDSTDEKMHQKMRLVREKEAKEIAKKKQKEIVQKAKDDLAIGKTKSDEVDHGVSDPSTAGSGVTVKKEYVKPGFEGAAPKGKGMQLGKPKSTIAASTLPSKFAFGKKDDLFASSTSETEPRKKELDQQTKIDLKIHEIAN